jgi:hypothetical protein
MKNLASRCWKGCESLVSSVEGLFVGLVILWNLARVVLNNFIVTGCITSTNFKEIRSSKGDTISNVYGPDIITRKLKLLDLMQNMGAMIR